LIQTHGEFFTVGIGRHVVTRSFMTLEGHGASSFGMYVLLLPFYFVTVFISFFPWSIKLPSLIRKLLRKREAGVDVPGYSGILIDTYLLWGIAIIFVTFLIKLAFYKLTAASGRSMAKMRNVAPRIKAIQERYKDDREQLGRQMMELYKREKINPLAGCLPILIQIPFFFAFYRVLLESVEMRQAPFFGWINDLSSRDPFFILPLLMGAAMFAQFKLQPMPSTDPMQAKVFAFMPVIMSVTMAWFPSGLVLYWLTNTLLSIAQQWRINKLVAAEQTKT